MDGEAKFNEVFLEGVSLKRSDVLGEVGQGWAVAISTLGRERLMLGAQAVSLQRDLEAIREEASARGSGGDQRFRQQWVEAWIKVQLLRVTWRRVIGAAGDSSNPRTSVLKLVASELQRDIANLGGEVVGMDVAVGERGARWRQKILSAPGQTIAGGTSEIQRNIIAERILGLPRA
jgi:alkylation response protein AidB-like acyl-CoA dehydrogenase